MKIRNLVCAAACAATVMSASAFAAVSTTCGDPTTCSLTSLLSGDSITVDDVTFGSFIEIGDFGSVPVDTDGIFVTGVSGGTTAALDFTFEPSLSVSGANDFISYVFDLVADLAPMSTRTITAVELSFVGTQLDITGDAQSLVTTIADAALIDIFDDSFLGEQNSGSSPLAALTSVAISNQLDLLGFEDAAFAIMSGFRFELTLDGQVSDVPLPAGLPLFAAGLVLLRTVRKKKPAAIAA